MEPGELALDPRYPAPRGQAPLPRQRCRHDGHTAHRSLEPAAISRIQLNPGRPAGRDARHPRTAGDGQATTGTQPVLKLRISPAWLVRLGGVASEIIHRVRGPLQIF
jgi:hypothetical protein